MARKTNTRERKPYIIVFWEGESEEAYMKFMRNEFHEYLNLTVNPQKGVFEAAKKAFSTSGIYADDTALVDEIWFIFDTEPELRNKWDEYYATIRQLRKKKGELLRITCNSSPLSDLIRLPAASFYSILLT